MSYSLDKYSCGPYAECSDLNIELNVFAQVKQSLYFTQIDKLKS